MPFAKHHDIVSLKQMDHHAGRVLRLWLEICLCRTKHWYEKDEKAL
jgi:hypothetical protein